MFRKLTINITGVRFPAQFMSIAKTILRRLFRVYAHIYHSHFDQICALGIEGECGSAGRRKGSEEDGAGIVSFVGRVAGRCWAVSGSGRGSGRVRGVVVSQTRPGGIGRRDCDVIARRGGPEGWKHGY